MRYDADRTKTLCEQYRNERGLSILDIAVYLRARVGVCRHQAIAAAYIEKRLIEDRHLSGRVGLERNVVIDRDGIGGHAWAVNRGTVVYRLADVAIPSLREVVIDPAQDFTGTKVRAAGEKRWDYALPTDNIS